MGQGVQQDWAIPLAAVHGLLLLLEEEFVTTQELVYHSLVVSLGAFTVIAFCGSFRGPEVFLVDLHGLRKVLLEDKDQEKDHVVIPLMGRFKGEFNMRYHLAPLASVMDLGLVV